MSSTRVCHSAMRAGYRRRRSLPDSSESAKQASCHAALPRARTGSVAFPCRQVCGGHFVDEQHAWEQVPTVVCISTDSCWSANQQCRGGIRNRQPGRYLWAQFGRFGCLAVEMDSRMKKRPPSEPDGAAGAGCLLPAHRAATFRLGG